MKKATVDLSASFVKLSVATGELFGVDKKVPSNGGGPKLGGRVKALKVTGDTFKVSVNDRAGKVKDLEAEIRKYEKEKAKGLAMTMPQSLVDCHTCLKNSEVEVEREARNAEDRRAVDTKLLYEDFLRREIKLHLEAAELLSKSLCEFRKVDLGGGAEHLRARLQAIGNGACADPVIPGLASSELHTSIPAPTSPSPLPILSASTIANLKTLISFVEDKCSDEVGIYRLSGSGSMVNEVCQRVLADGASIGKGEVEGLCDYDVNVATGALGRTLSSHQPVIPYQAYEGLMGCKDVEAMGSFLSSLDWESATASSSGCKTFLKVLLSHFNKVALFEDTNKMGMKQIATCVGCKLFRDNEEAPKDLTEAGLKVADKSAVFLLLGEWGKE